MTYPHISGICYESIVDGPGIRTAIFMSGCTHACPGCHNPLAQDPCAGTVADDYMVQQIANNIRNNCLINGITLTGGDPLFNPEATYHFLYSLRNKIGERWKDLTVWMYTGDIAEHFLWDNRQSNFLQLLLSFVDVVVDGPFVQELADKRLPFKGSSNQRIIDVPKSLHSHNIVEYTL